MIHNASKIPVSVKNGVKSELDTCEEMKIIERIIESTDNKKIGSCLDPKEWNKVMKCNVMNWSCNK